MSIPVTQERKRLGQCEVLDHPYIKALVPEYRGEANPSAGQKPTRVRMRRRGRQPDHSGYAAATVSRNLV